MPLLVEDFPRVSADNLEYTFSITPGIYHYDPAGEVFGEREREVRAEDVVHSVPRLADLSQKAKGCRLIEGLDERRSKSKTGGNYAGLTVLGSYEFQIKLTQPYPRPLYFFTMNYSAPMPREVLDECGTAASPIALLAPGSIIWIPSKPATPQWPAPQFEGPPEG